LPASPRLSPVRDLSESPPPSSSIQLRPGRSSPSWLHPTAKSKRTALILDRFSIRCKVLYMTNDNIIQTMNAMERSFYDFVSRQDEALVQSWIDAIKGWGVNESGQPSDGGFGFGKFHLLPQGRDSSVQLPESLPSSSRRRNRSSPYQRHHSCRTKYGDTDWHRVRSHSSSTLGGNQPSVLVDAIFSPHSDGLMVILRKAAK